MVAITYNLKTIDKITFTDECISSAVYLCLKLEMAGHDFEEEGPVKNAQYYSNIVKTAAADMLKILDSADNTPTEFKNSQQEKKGK